MTVEQAVALLGALTALLVAIGTVLVQVVLLARKVDGRLSELLELTRTSSHAEGVKEQSDRSSDANLQP